jgi:hypothetical protein
MNIYGILIFSVILYGCKTWSLILERVFKNRVLEKIFGLKREELKREWRRLHNNELYDLYSSPSSESSERDGQGIWHVWETGEVQKAFWWESEGKRPLNDLGVDGRKISK